MFPLIAHLNISHGENMSIIKINKENTKKIDAAIRNMSEEHWKALKAIASMSGMTMPNLIASLVEDKIENISN